MSKRDVIIVQSREKVVTVISFQGCEVALLGLSFPAGFSGKDFIL